MANSEPEAELAARLTERQLETLRWAKEGKTNSVIAMIIGWSHDTVKKDLQKVYKILGVGNRMEAVNCLWRLG